MHVPITHDELNALIGLSANGFDPRVIPLTHASGEHGSFAIESDASGADWALAQLALRRSESASTVRVGGQIQHTGARDAHVGARGTGYHQCEDCGGREFSCTDAARHDNDDPGDGYSFPDYGVRLDQPKIQALLMRSGLVSEYGAAQMAAWLDMEAYVLREPNTEEK